MLNAARRTYQRDGFVLLRPLFGRGEAETWKREAERLLPGMAAASNPLLEASPVFAELANDHRVQASAAALLGEPAKLLSGSLLYHGPGAHGLDIHQDYAAWRHAGLAAGDMISVLLAIDSSHAANGAMEFYAGLHQHWEADGPRPDPGGAEPRMIPLEPGDALWFHALAPHRTGPNRSLLPRRALCFTFAAVSRC